MSLEAVHVWQSETLRDAECCLCDTACVFPPCPSQLKKWAAIGQLSCRDACQAYRSVTNQAEKLQEEHLSLFSLLSLIRMTQGDWGAKNSTNLPFLPCIYLWFFSSSSLVLWKSDMSVSLLNVKLFNSCNFKQHWCYIIFCIQLTAVFRTWSISISYSCFCLIHVWNGSHTRPPPSSKFPLMTLVNLQITPEVSVGVAFTQIYLKIWWKEPQNV